MAERGVAGTAFLGQPRAVEAQPPSVVHRPAQLPYTLRPFQGTLAVGEVSLPGEGLGLYRSHPVTSRQLGITPAGEPGGSLQHRRRVGELAFVDRDERVPCQRTGPLVERRGL